MGTLGKLSQAFIFTWRISPKTFILKTPFAGLIDAHKSSERVVRSQPQPWEYTLGLNSGPVYWGCCVCVCVNLKVFCVNSWPYEDEGKDVTNK